MIVTVASQRMETVIYERSVENLTLVKNKVN